VVNLRQVPLVALLFSLIACGAPPSDQISARREFTLLVAGDIGECTDGGPFLTGKLLDHLDGIILAAGDIAYERGSDADFRSCFDRAWGRHKARIHPVPGNHEYASKHAAPYYRYFGERAAPPNGYYSFDLGSWHVVALNSNIGTARGSDQERWLRDDLQKTASRCILAFMHHSYLSSGWHGRTESLTALVEDFHHYGVSIVITGHDHHYERFTPTAPNDRADGAYGVRFFVVGTGGAELHSIIFRAPGSEAAQFGVWGLLGLNLHESGYDWEFLPAQATDFRDAGSGRCSTRAAAVDHG
jgi:acid phosphatase type 7